MKKILAFACASLCLASFASASGLKALRYQDSAPPDTPKFGFSAAFDFASKELIPVVTAKIGTQHDLFHKGWDVDVLAIAGASAKDGAGTGGFAVAHSFPISRESYATLGFFGRSQSGQRMHGGLLIGITGSF